MDSEKDVIQDGFAMGNQYDDALGGIDLQMIYNTEERGNEQTEEQLVMQQAEERLQERRKQRAIRDAKEEKERKEYLKLSVKRLISAVCFLTPFLQFIRYATVSDSDYTGYLLVQIILIIYVNPITTKMKNYEVFKYNHIRVLVVGYVISFLIDMKFSLWLAAILTLVHLVYYKNRQKKNPETNKKIPLGFYALAYSWSAIVAFFIWFALIIAVAAFFVFAVVSGSMSH